MPMSETHGSAVRVFQHLRLLRFVAMGLCLLGGLVACAVDSPNIPPNAGVVGTGNTARISGRVQDSTEGIQAEVRLIRLDSAEGVAVDTIKTDTDGSFSFDALPAGLYRVVVDQDSLRGAVVDSIRLTLEQKRDLGSVIVRVYVVQQVFVTINNYTIQSIYINYPANPVPQRGDSIVLRALPGDSQVVYIAVADGNGTKLLRYRLSLVDGQPALIPLADAPAVHVDPLAASVEPPRDTIELPALRDVAIDRDGWNAGRDAHIRLYYDDGVALLDFGAIDSIIAGRKVVSARLSVHGWITPLEDSSALVASVAPRDWIEGTGHWYWWNGAAHNGFATAFANYPDFDPPQDAEDPATASGIRWSTSTALRAALQPVADTSATLPEPAFGYYPLPKDVVPVVFDVTSAVQAMSVNGARSFALTQAGNATGAKTSALYFFSRENPAGPQYAPHLVLVLER